MRRDKKTLNTNFMLLMLGRIVSDIGTGVQAVAMPLYIIDVGGSAATVGLFTFLSLVPALLIYPFAGVFGDRLNRKSIMVGTDLSSGVVILTMSRMFSIVGMITKGGMPFGALVYGVILNRAPVHWTMLVTTFLMMIITCGFLISVLKSKDDILLTSGQK